MHHVVNVQGLFFTTQNLSYAYRFPPINASLYYLLLQNYKCFYMLAKLLFYLSLKASTSQLGSLLKPQYLCLGQP